MGHKMMLAEDIYGMLVPKMHPVDYLDGQASLCLAGCTHHFDLSLGSSYENDLLNAL